MKALNNNYRISAGKQYFFSTIILFSFIIALYYIQDVIGYQTVSLILLLVNFLLPIFNFERGPIITAAVISALAWDYYFIPPHFTMHIAETEDVVMLFMFFIVAITNGVLTSQLRNQKNIMGEKEKRSTELYELVKSLSEENELDIVNRALVYNIYKVFGCQSVLYFPSDETKLSREPHAASTFKPDEMEWLAAEIAFLEKRETGKFTDSVQGANAIYFPLQDNGNALCIVGVNIDEDVKDDKQIQYLRAFVNEAASFIKKCLHAQAKI